MARREVGLRRWWCAALAAGLGLLEARQAGGGAAGGRGRVGERR